MPGSQCLHIGHCVGPIKKESEHMKNVVTGSIIGLAVGTAAGILLSPYIQPARVNRMMRQGLRQARHMVQNVKEGMI